MRPSIESDAAPGHVSRAVDFLVEHQSSDGAWRDFSLKPGRSDAWVTAYVGSKLLQLAQRSPSDRLKSALTAATRFMQRSRNRESGSGWGYNWRCDTDADSTARAILFLREIGAPVSLADYAALVKFQLDDGSFATYKDTGEGHGWGRGHPDVTVVALQALAGCLLEDHVLVRKGLASLEECLDSAHPLASYWWPSDLYMARELLLLSRTFSRASRFSVPPIHLRDAAGAFGRALALDVACLRGRSREATAGAILLHSTQLTDGSWPSEPILRLTDPRALGFDDPRWRQSRLYTDDRRIFTTATVAAAIARASKLYQPFCGKYCAEVV